MFITNTETHGFYIDFSLKDYSEFFDKLLSLQIHRNN